MSNATVLPKEMRVWRVDNTARTFDQWRISPKMHPPGGARHADGAAARHQGRDPISNGQLPRRIEKGEKDPNHRLKRRREQGGLPPQAKKKGPALTRWSRRHERPSRLMWLVRNTRN